MLQALSEKLIKATDFLFAGSSNPFHRGDLVAAGERWFPREKHPAMWLKVPQDLKRSLLWHGKLITGDSPAYLCTDKMTDYRAAMILSMALKRALKYTTILATGVAALSLPAFMATLDALPAFPTWALDNGAYLAVVSWAAGAVASMAWTFASVVISNGWPLALLFPVFAWYAFMNGLQNFWESVSTDMRRPTLDALAFWNNQTQRREEEYATYNHVVVDINNRLSNMPFFPLGVSTGTMAANGVNNAPLKGNLIGYDGDSIRRHMICMGDTGTGKTRLVIEPAFVNVVVNSVWPEGYKIGAYITDGKGVLWRDLLPHCAHRMDEVRIVGLGPDQYGINLIEGQTPAQVADAMQNVAAQLSGRASPGEDFWSVQASLVVKNAAILARALECGELVKNEFIETEGCRPYSLMGIYQLATDDDMCRKAIKVAQDLYNADDESDPDRTNILKKGVKAGTWLTTKYHEIANETKTGYTANINAVLGRIEDNDEINRRFCTGIYENTIDIDYCLKGGITMLAIGGAAEGNAGKFVAVWAKTRLMQAARARNIANPDFAKKIGCAMFADEFQSLVTVGTADSDGEFWNVGRSSGLFLACAATQSMSAIEQAIGKVATENIMSNMSTRILLRTKDKATLMYYQELLGKSLQAVSSIPGVYSNHAQIMEKFKEPKRRYEIDSLAGLLPTEYSAWVHVREAYNIDHLIAMNDQLPIEKQESFLSLKKRQEDMIAKAVGEANQFNHKIDIERLMTGSGYALVMCERGDGSRVDFADLKPIREAMEGKITLAA